MLSTVHDEWAHRFDGCMPPHCTPTIQPAHHPAPFPHLWMMRISCRVCRMERQG